MTVDTVRFALDLDYPIRDLYGVNAVDIAKVCHAANTAIRECFGEDAPPPFSLDNGATTGVLYVLSDPCIPDEMLHQAWMKARLAAGWTHGVYDPAQKTHPNLVPFEQLDPRQKLKDRLFRNIVRSFIPQDERKGFRAPCDENANTLWPLLLKDDGSPVEYITDAIVEKCIHSYVVIDVCPSTIISATLKNGFVVTAVDATMDPETYSIDIGVAEVKKELHRTIVSYLSFLLADMQASRLTTKLKLPTDGGEYGTPQPHPRVMVDSQNKDR